jgi:hypothetical protein
VDDADLPPPWISDSDLLRLIERVTKKSATLADARAWRKAIERERARRARRRYGLAPALRSAEVESTHALVVDFLLSPEGQVLVALLWSVGTLIADRLDADARRLHDRLLHQRALARDLLADIDGLRRYSVEKLAPGGRRMPPWPDYAAALPGDALAALNSATPAALVEWRDRLAAARRSPAMRPYLLRRLCDAGADVRHAHPDLDVGRPMSGPSLGIWPPPAPEAESEAAPGDDPAANLVPGRK